MVSQRAKFNVDFENNWLSRKTSVRDEKLRFHLIVRNSLKFCSKQTRIGIIPTRKADPNIFLIAYKGEGVGEEEKKNNGGVEEGRERVLFPPPPLPDPPFFARILFLLPPFFSRILFLLPYPLPFLRLLRFLPEFSSSSSTPSPF